MLRIWIWRKIFDETRSAEELRETRLSLPSGTHLTSLSENNVEKINAAWPHRYEGSEKFISYSINFHMSAGLFDDDGELLAWSLRYDNGAIGVLQVDSKQRRKGYGTVMAKAMAKKIAEESDMDVTAQIHHLNETSISMFKKIGFKELTPHTWFVLTSK